MDPGEHLVEAHAKGKKMWWVKFSFGLDPSRKTVIVPILEDSQDPASSPLPGGEPAIAPVSSTPTPHAPAPRDEVATGFAGMSPETQRTVAWVLGGVGVVAAGVGTAFGVDAISKSNDAKSHCPTSSCSDSNAIQTNSDAKTSAAVSDVFFGGAIVMVAAGAILYFTAPASPASPVAAPSGDKASARTRGELADRWLRVAPGATPQWAGLVIDGRW
jgi:hypothetical protein